jgi:hypothetical protein
MALTGAEQSRKWREKNPEKSKKFAKKWREKNPEKSKKYSKKWREKNQEQNKKSSKKWREKNPDYYKEWRKNNRGKINALNSKRRAAKLQAAPSWANKKTIDMIYIIANICNKTVDHIVPLQSSVVCGLHWEANLQLLTQQENNSKYNKHDFDTPLGR